jgi:hypothetical protein
MCPCEVLGSDYEKGRASGSAWAIGRLKSVSGILAKIRAAQTAVQPNQGLEIGKIEFS